MRKLGQALMLLLLITVIAPSPLAIGAPKRLPNRPNKHWVARGTDRAVVIKITEFNHKLQAVLWVYDKAEGEDLYSPRTEYIELTQDLGKPGNGDGHDGELTAEWCELSGSNDEFEAKLRVEIHKHGRRNGNGPWMIRGGNRVVAHYTLVEIEDAKQAVADAEDKPKHDCDPVPEDDVLEEEVLTEDPGEAPPEYPDP